MTAANPSTTRVAAGDRPRLSPNARLLLIITTVNVFALNSVGSLINPYLREIGMSAAFVGTYFAIAALVQGFASFIGGFLADTFGRRRIWILGKVMQIAAYAVLAAGLRGQGMIVIAVLSGFGQVGVGAVMAMQAEAAHASWRATFFAIVQTANQLIGAVAPLLGGLVADRYGAGWAFFGAIPILLLVVRLISRLEERAAGISGGLTPGGRAGTATANATSRLAATRSRLATLTKGILHGPRPRMAVMMLAYTLVNGAASGSIAIGLPLILRDRFGLGYTGIGAVSTVSAVGAASCMILGARLADKYGRRRMIVLSKALCAGIVWLTPLTSSALQLYVLIFFATLTGNSANGALLAAKMECIADESRATFAGVDTGIDAVGMALGSLLAGLFYVARPMSPVLIAAAALSATALIMIIFLEETGSRGADKPKVASPLPAAGDQ